MKEIHLFNPFSPLLQCLDHFVFRGSQFFPLVSTFLSLSDPKKLKLLLVNSSNPLLSFDHLVIPRHRPSFRTMENHSRSAILVKATPCSLDGTQQMQREGSGSMWTWRITDVLCLQVPVMENGSDAWNHREWQTDSQGGRGCHTNYPAAITTAPPAS